MPKSPRYFVSFAVMTPKAGANPMGHAFVYFSKELPDGRVQVIDTYGYYAQPPSSDKSCHGRTFRKILRLNINFTKGYGHFEREEVRYMDKEPLPAVTYMISEEKYLEVADYLAGRIANEKEVIAELSEELARLGRPKTKFKGREFYLTDEVMALEIEKAKTEGREPRLSLFEMRLDLSIGANQLPSLSLARSNDCKVMAMEILARCGVSAEELEKFGRGQTRGALPLNPLSGAFHYDGEYEHLLAHSVGQHCTHKSANSGRIYHYRAWSASKAAFACSASFFGDGGDSPEVNMYFSLPPQGILKTDSVSDEDYQSAKKDYRVTKKFKKEIITVLSQLQHIEHDLVNAKVTGDGVISLNALLKKLRYFYSQAFSSYDSLKADDEHLLGEITRAKALLQAMEDGFLPYTAEFSISFEGEHYDFSMDSKANEKFCERFDRESNPLLDMHIF